MGERQPNATASLDSWGLRAATFALRLAARSVAVVANAPSTLGMVLLSASATESMLGPTVVRSVPLMRMDLFAAETAAASCGTIGRSASVMPGTQARTASLGFVQPPTPSSTPKRLAVYASQATLVVLAGQGIQLRRRRR